MTSLSERLKPGKKQIQKHKDEPKWLVFLIAGIILAFGFWLLWIVLHKIFTFSESSTLAPAGFLFLLGFFLVLKNGLRKGLAIFGTMLVVLVIIWAIIWFSESPEYRAGMKAYDKEDFAAAVEKFNVVLEAEPKNSEVYLKRGQALWRLGNNEAALKDLNRAIALDYAFKDESYSARGLVHADLGNHRAAADDFSVALKENRNPYDLSNRGIMYLRLKQYAKAEKDFEKALSLDKNYSNALWGLGDALYEQGKLQEALKYYEKYIKKSSSVPAGLKAKIARIKAMLTNKDPAGKSD